jgi:organic radical activating enzyme
VHYQKVDVRNLRIPRGDIVVITGGEPLLQQRLLYEALVPFVIDHIIQFETNGTVLPKELVGMPATYVVSPKLSNNGADPLPRRIRLDTLRWFAARGAHFKFVVGSEEDVREVDELVREVRPAHIWLMPLGSTPEEVASRAPMVAQACLDRGWRYSDRLHIRMWGNERGR